MTTRRWWVFIALAVAGVLTAPPARLAGLGSAAAELPDKLSDQEFWRLTEELSEPNGAFQSDNLLSNEMAFARIVPDLEARMKPGGVYLGVGPEQNFTYIAAMRPRIAFITDVRRGNLHLHLMYKALFELSADRAEFVSRLFTKPRPPGLPAGASAAELMAAFWDATTAGEDQYGINLKAIQDHLTRGHGWPLSADDLQGVAGVYRAFYWYGPWMTYSARASLTSAPGAAGVTYRALMTQTDATGREYSYLASEERFRFVKDLEARNLLVPVVGNFSGPKALRAVGTWVREHGAAVGAFYLSNVESYLRRDNTWQAFCANVATFPLSETSLFIRPSGNGVAFNVQLNTMTSGTTTFITTASPPVPIRFVTASGTNSFSGASALVPIAEEVKACAR